MTTSISLKDLKVIRAALDVAAEIALTARETAEYRELNEHLRIVEEAAQAGKLNKLEVKP